MNIGLKSIKRHIDEGDLLETAYKKVRNKVNNVRTSLLAERQPGRRVAVIGWIGAFNLGDEMMLDVTLGYFAGAGIVTTLIAHKDTKEVRRRYSGHAIVSRRPLSREVINKTVLNNDALFVNGGALIDDRDYGNEDSLARDISRLARAFIQRNKKVIVYGISTNSNISNPEAIKDYKYLIEHATHFSVRDKYSKDELSKIADPAKIHLVDDLVFADKYFAKKIYAKSDDGRIVVVPIFDKDSFAPLESLLGKLIETTEADIRVVSFYDEDNHESRSLEAALVTLGDNRHRVKEVIVPRNARELSAAFGDADLVLSMRYHGTLFAGAMGKRVLRIDHNKHPHYLFKNKYLASHYGYGADFINITDIPKIPQEDLKGIMDRVSVQQKIATRVIYSKASKSLKKAIKLL
jgi:polysaccharide pyruvyl transferase WcaK-like protein